MMKKIWLLLAMAVILVPLGLARAAEFASSSDGTITVPSGENHHNYYAAGRSVTIEANIDDDLAIAGQSVVVNGNVGNSLFVAGATVNLRGDVGNNARVAGSTVTISGHIKGDLFVLGDTVVVTSDSVVDGGLYAAGSSVQIDGHVTGEVRSASSDLVLRGETGRVITYGTVSVKKTAQINGDLTYTSDRQAAIETGATISGQTTFHQTHAKTNHFLAIFTLTRLAMLIGWFLLAILIGYCWPGGSRQVLANFAKSPAVAIGYGLLGLIVLPIASFILLISVIGTPIGWLLGLLWGLLVTLGWLLGFVGLGALTLRLFTKDQELVINWQTIITGIVVSTLLGFLPFLGGLVDFIFALLGIGGLVMLAISRRQRLSETPPTP